MNLVNKHGTIILGIDIHFTELPPFNPLQPFIGLVFDVMDYIPFIGASIIVNGMRRGVSDTSGMLVTWKHIPIATGPFVEMPLIAHQSVNFFGSMNTYGQGRRLSPTTYMKMTCNDIGIPLSAHAGEKFKPMFSLFAPTSFSIPIPIGMPVMLGGPFVPDLTGALINLVASFGFSALLKGGRKLLSKALNSKATKALSATMDKAFKKMKCLKDPVNMVTGNVLYTGCDFELPGILPLKWERHWHSDSGVKGLLGHGTTCLFDTRLEIMDGTEIAMLLPDGRAAGFELPLPGEENYNRIERLTLRHCGDHFEVKDHVAQFIYVFNGDLRLAMLRNEQGFAIKAVYHSGVLSQVIDSAGRVLKIFTDQEGRITAIHSEQQLLAGYAYNEAGDLCKITDALQQATCIVYEQHHMIKKTDRNGQSFYWKYEGHRCVRTWGDGGLLEGQITYHAGYNVMHSPGGRSEIFYYDEDQLCTQITDALGNNRFMDYTEWEELYRSIDEEGNMTGYRYDDRGNCVSIILPDKVEELFIFDETDRMVMHTDGAGNTVVRTYNELGLPEVVINADNSITSYSYDARHRLVGIENGDRKTLLQYDAQDNLASVTLPDGSETRWEYDQLGHCIRRINASGGVQSLVYDLLGRATRIQQPDGNVIWLQYNAYEEVLHARDSQHDILFEYTPLGSLRRRTERGATWQLQYNGEDELMCITNEVQERYCFERNGRGEIVKETGFDGQQRQYDRYANGWIRKVTRPEGRSTTCEYDANGRIIRLEYHDGTFEVFSYDKNGLLTSAINDYAAVYFNRDNLGRVITERTVVNGQEYTVQSVFNRTGQRCRLQSSLGADLGMEYTAMGLLSRMTATQGQQHWDMRLNYNNLGMETDRWLPGNLSAHMAYDHAGHPLRQTVRTSGREARRRRYEWDANDRLVTMLNELTNGFITYGHDDFDNLAWAEYEDGQRQYKTPDAAGNIYTSATQRDRRYEAGGRLAWNQGWHYRYDAEGNLIEKSNGAGTVWKYAWYANGMLQEVTRPDGETVSFAYDALGRRMEKQYRGTVTRWIWDGRTPFQEWQYAATERPVLVTDAWGDLKASGTEPVEGLITWVFKDGSLAPAAKLTGDHAYSIISNYMGTPVEMYDESGQQVWAAELDIYGGVRSGGKGDPGACPFRFQGQYEDAETGLYYNRFRYYSPGEGNYISPDPVKLAGDNPTLYGYVKDVNTWVDTDGLGPTVPDFNTLKDLATNHLDFSTTKDGAVFWSGSRMETAQAWAAANGKTTLEQTVGGKYLDDLKLFSPGSPLSGKEAAEIWDIASKRFADNASGEVNVFSTGAKRIGAYGERTWWRIEKPALMRNGNVKAIIRRRIDGSKSLFGHVFKCH
ncbi:hypothetical protein DCC81_13955 [Chitinophaga parva]|uniref:Type IV secretion protein Rhs n=1 Tax=Chitinophaga parva TaxID=2169414 RepID=A0A2T7BGI7_9BACT|nr:DUF6531 domain-containing protein [Chitinophaga parva]PUZ25395.1 hypothetical protein DCC81_13955 [Chitinophaga parva]